MTDVLWRCVNGKHLMRFTIESADLKFLRPSVGMASPVPARVQPL